MNNSSEAFGNNRNGEMRDVGINFGESRLSDASFEPREFPEQGPDETDREYAEREMRADERLFLVGLVKAETQGPDGMTEALKAPDFRVRRTQRREFLDAIGKMSEEEYGARINNVLGVFDNDEARTTAMEIADYYWLRAKRRANEMTALDEAIAEENTVSRTHHEKPRKYRWHVDEAPKEPEMPRSQAEVMMANQQKYYREQKQERRGKKLFEKIKGVFSGFKKEKVAENRSLDIPKTESQPKRKFETDGYPAPVPAGKLFGRERPENGYFNNTDFYQQSQPGQYFGQEENMMPEITEPTNENADDGAESYVGRHARREERGPLHTNDFSFGEEGSF